MTDFLRRHHDAIVTCRLTRAFEQELASISQGLATQSLTPAAAQQRAQRVRQLAEVLVQGKDRFDTSGGGSGVTFSQSSRARLEGAGDWSLTTRMELQDLQ
ncbi:MAG TPA: hypothetical protein PKW60_00870, partial [Candidatus Hydrogenedentes bacterium]|nr:hypothetical protein [Candidatus Hydrogenedentota bacterium]